MGGPIYSKAEDRLYTFLCFRECTSHDKRLALLQKLNEDTNLPLIAGNGQKRTLGKEPTKSWITGWKPQLKQAERIGEFFTESQTATSMIYKHGMPAFNDDDFKLIANMLKQCPEPVDTIVERMWSKDWLPYTPNQGKGYGNPLPIQKLTTTNQVTKDDIMQAAFAVIRRYVPEKRDLHDVRTWPVEWMVELAGIWRSLGGKLYSVYDDPSPEVMLPRVRAWLHQGKPELKFHDDEFELSDMNTVKLFAVKCGFIRGDGPDQMLRDDKTIDLKDSPPPRSFLLGAQGRAVTQEEIYISPYAPDK